MNWKDNFKCTGCNLCVINCTNHALALKENQEGFLYPVINMDKCVECRKCEQVCPENKSQQIIEKADKKYPVVYAAINKDEEVRLKSTSGGVFSALAVFILKQGGSVVGAVYDNNLNVVHKLINSEAELESLRRSKYVQSNMGNIYSSIEEKLEKGKKVLFCGTPCQAAAVKKAIKKHTDKLYICDILCYGVSSPRVYRSYISWLENEYDSSLKELDFKNKRVGWEEKSTLAKFSNGKEYFVNGEDNIYSDAYIKYQLCSRECCYQCQYKSVPHPSDITLGDFWGLSNTRLVDNKGTSAVLINSLKGEELFREISESLDYKRSTLFRVAKVNDGLFKNQKKTDLRKVFFTNLNNHPFDEALNITISKDKDVYSKNGIKHRLKGKVAVIMGGGQTPGEDIGNGRAISVLFAREGARVVVLSKHLERAKKTVEIIEREGNLAVPYAADITNENEVENFFKYCEKEFGHIDILVNNVGVAFPEDSELHFVKDEIWLKTFSTNFFASLYCSRQVIPYMRKQGKGSIVQIASIGGYCKPRGKGGLAAYRFSKYAMIKLGEEIAASYAADGIRCNNIILGCVQTSLVMEKVIDQPQKRQLLIKERDQMVPLRGGQGTAWDTAYAALFLASDESRFITGVNLPVDGGTCIGENFL